MINNTPAVKFILLFVPVLLGMWLTGCKGDQTGTVAEFNYAYYPLDTGHYVTYQVDSISCYRSDFKKDTASYQIKEVITDTFYDNQNELNYELTLYRRQTSNAPWEFNRKWFVKKTITNLQKVEDDIRFIKLVFPPKEGLAWNGNIYVPAGPEPYEGYENWDYHYESVDAPYTINGFSFDSTLAVSCVDYEDVIEKKLCKEVYAKNVGLIYQQFELKTGVNLPSWETGNWRGFSIRMRMIDHN